MPAERLVFKIWKFTQVLTVYTVSRIVLNMENPSFSLLRPSQYLIHHIIFSDAKKKKNENAFVKIFGFFFTILDLSKSLFSTFVQRIVT